MTGPKITPPFKGETNRPPAKQPVVKEESPDLTLETVRSLREAIGVLDSAQVPPGWAPPPSDGSMIIRGATGSAWMNRLSSFVTLIILSGIVGIIILVVMVVKMARGPEANLEALTCPRAKTIEFASLPEILKNPASANLNVGVKRWVGQGLMLQSYYSPQPGGAVLRIWRDSTVPSRIKAIDVSKQGWTVCDALQQTNLVQRSDSLWYGDDAVWVGPKSARLPLSPSGWNLRLKADSLGVVHAELGPPVAQAPSVPSP